MTSKIFKSILTAAIAVLLASLVIIIGVLYPYFGGVQESQLKDELSLAAEAVQQLGESYLKNLDSDRYRLTWVGADGTVIFDSHADASAMENHADRKEVQEAFRSGSGEEERNSATLSENRKTLPSCRRNSPGPLNTALPLTPPPWPASAT